ncbi:MAG: phosphotransferase [Candidatus Heimdallarchaeota archaeon]
MDIQEEQLEAICRKLPAEYQSHSLLGRGAFNISYLLITNTGKFVLRIGNSTHTKNLVNEYNILKMLDGQFGPKVFLLDDSLKILPEIYLVEEFIEGVHPEVVFPEELILAFGEWYSRLHKYKSPVFPEYMGKLTDYSLVRAYEWRTTAFHENKHILEEQLRKHIETIYDQAF